MRYANVLFFATLLIMAFSAKADTPESVVSRYIDAYSAGVPTTELVDTYWMPTVTVHPKGLTANQLDAQAWAEVLETFRNQVTEQGWIRSEIVELHSCQLREELAIVSLSYNRVFKDGSKELDAVVYSLSGVDGWRLSSVWPVDIDALITCAE